MGDKRRNDPADIVLALSIAALAGTASALGYGASEASSTGRSLASNGWAQAGLAMFVLFAVLQGSATALFIARRRSKSAQASPANREFTSSTPQEIIQVFEENTDLQAQKITEPLRGKWLEISGPLNDVRAIASGALVTLAGWAYLDGNGAGVHMWFRDKKVINGRLSAIPVGAAMTIVGEISAIEPHHIILDNCEIIHAVTQDGTPVP